MAAAGREDICFDVVAVLPAAGSGVRMNLEVPKQFCTILGKPLISYTLDAFERVVWIKEIVVAVDVDHMKAAKQILKDFCHTKVRLVCGGQTRHRSVWKGIQSLTDSGRSPPDVVILHDAVRPFVDEYTLKRVTLAAMEHGAAGVIRPLVSTVIAQSCDGFLDHSLDRSKFRASEMPQAFRYQLIHNAYKECTEYDFEHGTECLHLAQKYSNTRAFLIDGPDSLWKVTYKKDLLAVEGTLREKQGHAVVVCGAGFQNFCDKLRKELDNRQTKVAYFSNVKTEQQLSQTSAEQLAVEVNETLRSCYSPCLSVVHVVDSRRSSNNTYSEGCSNPTLEAANVNLFLQTLFRSVTCCTCKVMVHVTISNDSKDLVSLKKATQEFGSWGQEHAVRCFGVWVYSPLDDKREDNDATSRHMEKAVELAVGAMMDVPAVFTGQVFDTIT